jgi:hypothetical protein
LGKRILQMRLERCNRQVMQFEHRLKVGRNRVVAT